MTGLRSEAEGVGRKLAEVISDDLACWSGAGGFGIVDSSRA